MVQTLYIFNTIIKVYITIYFIIEIKHTKKNYLLRIKLHSQYIQSVMNSVDLRYYIIYFRNIKKKMIGNK